MILRIPQDAWARLAAAAGYNARGNRVTAEHHLDMFLTMISRDGDAPWITMDEAKEMMLEVFGVAYGKESLQRPNTRLIQEPKQCSARVIGRHGAVERCQNAAMEDDTMCKRCSKIHPPV